MINEEQLLLPLSKLFARKVSKFPGMMPTSVDRSNVELLRRGYVASSKADGDGVLAFVSENKLLLKRRNMQNQIFTLSKTFERDFIFEGEYFILRNHFLIFDTLVFEDEPVRANYLTRLELANHFINKMCPESELHSYANSIIATPCLQPLPSSYKHGVTWKSLSISMSVKPAYDSRLAASLWNARQSLPYKCDGIIFTRLWCRYYPFSENTEAVLKWKLHVTSDFIVKLRNKEELSLLSAETGTSFLPSTFAFPSNNAKYNAVLYVVHNADVIPVTSCVLTKEQVDTFVPGSTVCEFGWNQDLSIWEFQRSRPDKTCPNTLHTVLACIASIQDAISIEEISKNVI